MPKKNLSVAMAYVGVVAGAGLASGQDLLQYFLSFGVMGVLGIAVMGGLNVVFGSLALQLGSYFRSDHHDEVFGRIAHPVVNRLIDIVLVASSFIMGFVMLAGVVVLTGITLFLNVGTVKDVDVPMQEIARSIHPAFAFVYTLAIFALIYNTVFSLFYSVARRFSGGSEARMRLILIGVVVAGLAASMAGFKSLVGIMYPILGYLGMALMVVVAMGWWRERHNIGREENLRRKMVRLLLRKHTPRAPYTTEHRRDVRALAEASVADASQLRSDADELAGQIVANEDDVRAFAQANLPVDEDKVAELVGPRSA